MTTPSAPNPPYRSQVADPKTGMFTDPWVRWLNAFYTYVDALPTSTGVTPGSGTVTNNEGVLTQYRLTVGNGGADIQALASGGNANYVLHDNPFGPPLWSQINLSTDVEGLLPITNGGTGTATPGLVAGPGILISGPWPDQTIAATGAILAPPLMEDILNEEPFFAPGVGGGTNGANGATGAAGPIGPAVYLEAPEADEPIFVPGTPGATGTPGASGSQGPMGPAVYLEAPEADEPIVIPGPAGSQGPAGLNGTVGYSVAIDGVDGEEGMPIPGAPGPQGNTGATGVPGPAVFLEAEPAEEFFPLPGPAGVAGASGLTGAQGPTGPAVYLEADPAEEFFPLPGPAGVAGASGLTGAQGPTGPAVYLEAEPAEEFFPLPGPAGAQGSNGSAGAQGPIGPTAHFTLDYAPDEDTAGNAVSSSPQGAGNIGPLQFGNRSVAAFSFASPWSTGAAYEVPAGALYSYSNSQMILAQSAYYNGSWLYKYSATPVSVLTLASGALVLDVAPSGTANAAVTLTQAATIANTGQASFGIPNTAYTAAWVNASPGTAAIAPFGLNAGVLNTTAQKGAMEFDGSALYFATAAAARGVVRTEQIIVNASTYALANSTAMQAIFPAVSGAGALTLPVGTYYFECQFLIQGMSVATPCTFGFSFLGTAVLTNSLWDVVACITGNGSAGAAAYMTVLAGGSGTSTLTPAASGDGNGIVRAKGILRVSTAGTIIPAASTTVAVSTLSIYQQASFKITPIGSGLGNIAIGNWS